MPGGGGNQTSTVYQSSLPEYARPYFESLMSRAAGESRRPYQRYRGERIADQDPSTLQGLSGAEQFGNSGLGVLPNAINGAMPLTQYQSGFQPGAFGAEQAQQYMSPYMDAVTDRAKQSAVRDYQQQQVFNDTEAARAGAFGGSRAAVMRGMAQNDTMNRMSDIDVQGRQSAFENAQQQFERDRSAQAQAEQFRQGAAGIDLNASNALAQYQQQGDNMQLQRIQALLGAGQARQDYNQQRLDMRYNDFVNQRDAQRQNLQFYSSLLQGVPISANQNVTQTQPGNPIAGGVGSLTGLQALYALSRQPTA